MKKNGETRKNLLLAAGLLLTAGAILLGDAGLIGHGLKLTLLVLAIALELWGGFRQCGANRS